MNLSVAIAIYLLIAPILLFFLEIVNRILDEYIDSKIYQYSYSLEITTEDLSEIATVSLIPAVNLVFLLRFMAFSVASCYYAVSTGIRFSLNTINNAFIRVFGGKKKVIFKIGKK